jgi:hypothetical protein
MVEAGQAHGRTDVPLTDAGRARVAVRILLARALLARRSIRIDAPQEPCKSRSGALRAVGLGTSLVADTGLKGVQQKCLCPSMPVERGSVIPGS